MRKLTTGIAEAHPLVQCLGALLLTGVLAWLQHHPAMHLSHSAGFVLLTGGVAWIAGLAPALVAAAGSAAFGLVDDWFNRGGRAAELAWFTSLLRLGTFVGVAWIVGRLRESTRQLEARITSRTAELETQIAEENQIRARLQESNERFSQLAENISEVFWLRETAKGQVLYVSPAYETVWGRSCESLYEASSSWQDTIHPEDRKRVQAAVSRQAAGKYDEEYRIVRPDGSIRWIRDRAFPVRDAEGKAVRISGIAEDITARKEAEKALRASEQRYRSLTEESPDAIFIVGRDLRMTYVNRAAREWSEGPGARLEGAELGALMPEEMARHHVRLIREVFETAVPRTLEERISFRGGNRWLQTRVVPLYDTGGVVSEVMGVSRDISESKQIEQQLAEALELNRKTIEASTLGIAAYRASGPCVFANEALARIAGGPMRDILEQNYRESESWKRSGFLAAAEKTLRGGGPTVGEMRLLTSWGRDIWVEYHMASFVSGGEPHLLLMMEDVSERKRADTLLRMQRDTNRALSSMNELRPALEYLLEMTVQLDGLDSAGVYLVDPRTGGLVLVASRGLKPEFVREVREYSPGTPHAAVVGGGQAIYSVPDRLDPAIGAQCKIEGLKAVGIVPIRSDEKVIAVLNVATHKGTEIPMHTRVVLEAMAVHVQGAIARIHAEEARRDTEERMRTLIANAPIVLYGADAQGVITFEEGRALAGLGIVPGQNVGLSLEEAYSQFPALVTNGRQALAGEDVSSVLELGGGTFECRFCCLRTEAGQVAGCIGVGTDISERSRLERQILEISDREQARIGQDIHDGLCQQLVSIAFDANSLADALAAGGVPRRGLAERIANSIDGCISESRRLARGLYPVKLEAEGLASALEELATSTRGRFGIDCEFINDSQVAMGGQATATHLYRVAQEAVTNALKHSGARHIWIHLRQSETELCLEVSDDGVAGKPASTSSGMGLHIMDYRARSVGGTLEIKPRPGTGTVVCCCVPLGRL